MTSRPILFIGDSITDCGRREDAPDFLGDGYVRLVADQLPQHTVINRGISGNRVIDLRDRWETDAVEPNPQLLTVYVGINDTWRRYDSHDPTSAEVFEENYRTILTTAVDRVSPAVVLVEPFLVPVTADQERWFDDLDPKREAVARLAAEFGTAFVPLHSLMSAAAAENGAPAIAQDGVHPTDIGHRIIADAWLAAAGW